MSYHANDKAFSFYVLAGLAALCLVVGIFLVRETLLIKAAALRLSYERLEESEEVVVPEERRMLALEQENEVLEELLGITETEDMVVGAGRVLVASRESSYESLVVQKPADRDVTEGMPVISRDGGLVGYVGTVGEASVHVQQLSSYKDLIIYIEGRNGSYVGTGVPGGVEVLVPHEEELEVVDREASILSGEVERPLGTLLKGRGESEDNLARLYVVTTVVPGDFVYFVEARETPEVEEVGETDDDES